MAATAHDDGLYDDDDDDGGDVTASSLEDDSQDQFHDEYDDRATHYDHSCEEIPESELTREDEIVEKMQNRLPRWFVDCYELPSQRTLFLTMYAMIAAIHSENWMSYVKEDIKSHNDHADLVSYYEASRGRLFTFIQSIRSTPTEEQVPQFWRVIFYHAYIDLTYLYDIGDERDKGVKSRIHPNYRFSHSLARYGFSLPGQPRRRLWQRYVRQVRVNDEGLYFMTLGIELGTLRG